MQGTDLYKIYYASQIQIYNDHLAAYTGSKIEEKNGFYSKKQEFPATMR